MTWLFCPSCGARLKHWHESHKYECRKCHRTYPTDEMHIYRLHGYPANIEVYVNGKRLSTMKMVKLLSAFMFQNAMKESES